MIATPPASVQPPYDQDSSFLRALYDKVILTGKLCEERDVLSRDAIRALKATNEALRSENVRHFQKTEKLKRVIQSLRNDRHAFDNDVVQLTRAADLLAIRETEMAGKFKLVHECNADLQRELDKKAQELAKMQRRVDEETCPSEDFVKVKNQLAQVIEEKRLSDEAQQFFHDERHASVLAVKDAEARVDILVRKVNSVEIELMNTLIREKALQSAVDVHVKESQGTDEERRNMSKRIVNLESDKASLLTQANYWKIEQRAELEAKRLAQRDRAVMEARETALVLQIGTLTEENEMFRRRINNLSNDLLEEKDRGSSAAFSLAVERKSHEEQLSALTQQLQDVTLQLQDALNEIKTFSQAVLSDPLTLSGSCSEAEGVRVE